MKAAGPFPPDFRADSGHLLLGDRTAAGLVKEAGGTPLFVYDRSVVAERVRRFRAAFPGVALHYAVKANPFGPLLAYMAGLVDGFDLASAGELDMLQAIGGDGLPTSFAGPGKTDDDLAAGLAAAVTINLESEAEWQRLHRLAARDSRRPKVAVRINPPFGLKGSGMKMGGLASPFGVDHDRVPTLVRRIIDSGADWRGLHVYAGSQSLSSDAIIESQRATVALAAEIAGAAGASPPEVNLGGGFGIPYFPGDQPLDVRAVGEALKETLANRHALLRDTKFILELGRWLVGEAGVYLTSVVDRKVSRGKTYLVTDGGLQHMLAASGNFGQLLRRNYPVAVPGKFGSEPEEEVTVVGCLCTPLDLLADEVMLPRAEVGDLVAIFSVGAYGLTASPQAFLSMAAAGEVLV
ncbi:pyridoxal-dependent decarboxylase, exosortase A system-associated [Sphingomonas sp. BN140010]|uniref:Pyridoxal-dependent decarboxylase, exosortase A system-associated n=1 Tax=Sphingomonas arvum TaxID=2992113 RepID=A0ABT3JIB3_9SPHN|nr:pyridoxal-dependent decarboxylase, exosortase A system-associated [Sphingomonas sp. BN140010]MCW3798795.1 pyridoxal-dependent decarboxylase, exosortase A system-associated [Sphingomonas sp. BN140010]